MSKSSQTLQEVALESAQNLVILTITQICEMQIKSRQLTADGHQVSNKFTVYLGHIDLLYMGEGLSL